MRLLAAPSIFRAARGLTATLVVAALVAAVLSGSGVGGAAALDGPTLSPGQAVAERSLARAQAMLGDPRARVAAPRASTLTPPAGDATLALRDLQQRRAQLPRTERRKADKLLERPSTPALAQNSIAVIHGTSGPGLDPAYPARVLATVTQVAQTYVDAGYRAPLPDGVLGGDARIDIYLADLAGSGAYGYCTSDQAPAKGSNARWAFCVLDDSYEELKGTSTATQILQVTTAHEFFHAVQYAYDSLEDGWFLESTAVWAEDQVYDDVNDNVQYAPYSPLARPRSSLDYFDTNGFRQYGSWLFFRWLSERFPAVQGGLPVIVRQFLEAADSTQGAASDAYSMQAISRVLRQDKLPIDKAFARFADANRRPRAFYSEAAANSYPRAPLAQKFTLSPRRRAASGKPLVIDHLASATTRFVPQKLRNNAFRLRIRVDLADKVTDPMAVVSTYRRKGAVKTKLVKLDKRGNGGYRTPFSTKRVRAVEVTLVNASTRYTKCYQVGVTYSCYGKPVDDGLVGRVRASVVR